MFDGGFSTERPNLSCLVNWNAFVLSCGVEGDEAKEMFDFFVKEIKESKEKIELACLESDLDKLLYELDKLSDSICYIGCPEIESAIKHFELSLKENAQDAESIRKLNASLSEAISYFLRLYQEGVLFPEGA